MSLIIPDRKKIVFFFSIPKLRHPIISFMDPFWQAYSFQDPWDYLYDDPAKYWYLFQQQRSSLFHVDQMQPPAGETIEAQINQQWIRQEIARRNQQTQYQLSHNPHCSNLYYY
jgi:hypothetical protein